MSKRRKNHVDKISGYEFIKVFLDFMCAWCAAPLDEDGPVYGVTISQPHLDWNEYEGRYVPLSYIPLRQAHCTSFRSDERLRAF